MRRVHDPPNVIRATHYYCRPDLKFAGSLVNTGSATATKSLRMYVVGGIFYEREREKRCEVAQPSEITLQTRTERSTFILLYVWAPFKLCPSNASDFCELCLR